MSQRCCCAPFEAKVEGISHFLYGKDKLPFVHSFALNLMVLCSVCRMSCALIGTTIFGAARIFPSTARFENDDDDDDSRTQISRSNCNQFFRLRNAISTVCVCRRHHQRHRCRRRLWHKSHAMFLSTQPTIERGVLSRARAMSINSVWTLRDSS